MARPLAICIEESSADADGPRFVRCVALAAGEDGLGLDRQGAITWRQPASPLRLTASDDGALQLRCGAGAPAVVLRRLGRELTIVEGGQPTPLLAGDELLVAERRLRLHVHGPAEAAIPPSALTTPPPALDLGPGIDVRAHPPKPSPLARALGGGGGRTSPWAWVVRLALLLGLGALAWWLLR